MAAFKMASLLMVEGRAIFEPRLNNWATHTESQMR
jgi:hypothetical protein